MEDIRLKFYSPVITGTAAPHPGALKQQDGSAGSTDSFGAVLQKQIEKNSAVNFSRHAVKRAADHRIELSQESLERLNEGVRLAGEKNLEDTLILVDNTAFLVNVKNNTVITAMENGEARGNVFTNITGTVIV